MPHLSLEERAEFEEILRRQDARLRFQDERNDLIEGNLKVVEKILPKYLSRGVDEHDLRQEGRLGLLKAAESYEPERGVPFPAHARYWVREFMRMHLVNHGHTIRVPLQTIRKHTRIERFKAEFHADHGRLPTEDEVSAGLKIAPATQKTVACCVPAIASEPLEFEHLVAQPDEEATPEEIRRIRGLHRALAGLPDDQREVLERCFDLDREGPASTRRIARDLCRPMRDVEDLRDRAIAALREALKA